MSQSGLTERQLSEFNSLLELAKLTEQKIKKVSTQTAPNSQPKKLAESQS